MEPFIYHKNQLDQTAELLLRKLHSQKIWCFYGSMGAGKTTLIQSICKKMGVIDTVNSPTFSIVNEYLTHENETIYHFDFYRIKHEKEALDIGADEYLTSGNICFIEWAEKIPSLIGSTRVELHIIPTDENNRQIYVRQFS